MNNKMKRDNTKTLEELVIEVKSVVKVTAGGRQRRFAACVVVGDRKGTVGIGSIRIYSSKIWDNGELVRELVPAKRDEDDTIGMIDLVTQTFFVNEGTGEFIAGPVKE